MKRTHSEHELMTPILFLCFALLVLCVVIGLITNVSADYEEPIVNFQELEQPVKIDPIPPIPIEPQKPQKTESVVVKEVSAKPIVKKTPTQAPVATASESQIDGYIKEICASYGVDPYLVQSIVYHESRYNPKAKNGACVGLMQVSTRWHSGRAEKLGITNFYDPYSNIRLGVDYIAELFTQTSDPAHVLMIYNMGHSKATELYKSGVVSKYAKSVIARADSLR